MEKPFNLPGDGWDSILSAAEIVPGIKGARFVFGSIRQKSASNIFHATCPGTRLSEDPGYRTL